MSKSAAEGIVEKAVTFTGIVRRFIQISLIDKRNNPINYRKVNVTFENGQHLLVESDNDGVIKFPVIAKGKVEITLSKEEEKAKENSKSEA